MDKNSVETQIMQQNQGIFLRFEKTAAKMMEQGV